LHQCGTESHPHRQKIKDVVFPIEAINEAFGRVLKSNVEYRFVIDSASLVT
jgi:D-arabinose 1-dehydrogenase-like Zn-dependent alcohol dehydrogenase